MLSTGFSFGKPYTTNSCCGLDLIFNQWMSVFPLGKRCSFVWQLSLQVLSLSRAGRELKNLLQLAKKKWVLNPNESWIDPGSNSAHRVFADRLRREGLITHNQRTGMLEITQQGIDYLDQAS